MKLFPLLCAAIGLLSSAQGATIVWQSSLGDNGLSLADGTTMLPTNSLIRLGFFDISDDIIRQNSTNLTFLNSQFHELDFDRIGGSEVLNKAGYFGDSVDLNTGATGLNIENKQLVLWAFASSDNSSVSQSLATATQTGIFYLAGSTWKVPGEFPGSSTTLDLTDLTGDTPTSDLATGANVVLGSFTNTPAGPYNSRNFALQVVPEPGTTGLAVVGGIAMLLRRRRRA